MNLNKITLILLLGMSSIAQSDTDGERAALARLIHELDGLKPIVTEAESQANPDQRPAHLYDYVRLDIQRVRSGIEDLLMPQRVIPRSFPPLKGDYRR